MSTSQRTMSQVRSILSKLDRTRSASRTDGAEPQDAPADPAAFDAGETSPIDGDTLIGGPKKPSTPTNQKPAQARPIETPSATPLQDPNRPGAQFGRAKPIPFRG